MKIFISQLMHNKSCEQIKEERSNIVHLLEKNGHTVIESVFSNFDETKPPIYYLAKSIDLLVNADLVIFMQGWEKGKGCRIEMQIAKDYNKKFLIWGDREIMLKGIDVSKWQEMIDWDKVKPQINYALLRMGWIGNKENHTLDEYFERNYNECKRLGIPVGVYLYNYCTSIKSAKSGAKWVLDNLIGKDLELPIYIDMEDESLLGLNKDTTTSIVCSFCNELESYGWWAGCYANLDWYNNYLNKDVIKNRYTTWIAHFGVKEDKYKNQYDILQYTNEGKIDGINGNVDLNIMYRDLINEIGKLHENNNPIPNVLKSVDEIANEVIRGDWGNGEDRKNNLKNAGYNYDIIQAKVNEIMNKPKYLTYVVKSGDNLSKIAQKYKTTWQEIYKLNKDLIGSNPNFIQIGQQLKIKI